MTTPTAVAPAPPAATPDSPPSRPAAPSRRRFTVAEYYAMAEAGILAPDERVELLDGEIMRNGRPIGDWHASSGGLAQRKSDASLTRTSNCENTGPDSAGRL